MKALSIALLRVSSSKQGLAGDSPERQKEDIVKLLPKYNAEVINYFELIESASGDIQPAVKVIDFAKEHPEIKYCFITYIDRFSRAGSYVYQFLKSQLAKYGVQLIDVAGVISPEVKNTLDTYGIEYKWSKYNPSHIAEIMAAESAHDEIRTILTRLIGSEIRYVRLGYWVGYAAYGYASEKVDSEHGKRVVLKPDSITSKWFVKMFELKIQGLNDEEIVKQVNAMGYKSRRVNVRDKQDKSKIIGYKGERILTVKQLNVFIQDPIYALVSTHKWLEKPQVIHGTPIVSIDMFNKANRGKIRIVDDNGQITILNGKPLDRYLRKSKNIPLYAYKDYVLCPLCRDRFKGSASRGKSGKLYPAYHCNRNGHKYLRIATGADATILDSKQETMEKTIYDFIKEVKFTDEFKSKFRQLTVEELEKRKEIITRDTTTKGENVLSLRAEKTLIVDKIKQLNSPLAIAAMEEELDRVEAELVQARGQRNDTEDLEIDLETILNHCKYFVEHLEDLLLGSTNPIQNAAFFGLVFDSVPTYEELKSGTPDLAPLFVLNEALTTSKSEVVSRTGIEPVTTSLRGRCSAN